MITIVCWRWKPPAGYRSTFAPATVYALREMISRHYARPFRFLCVTDEPAALPGIETVPLWSWGAEIVSPFGRRYPSCYRRLKLFAPDAGATFGARVLSIDLDMVITGDLEPLLERPEEFVIWGESDFPRSQWYNGSLWLLTTGSRPQVWTEFDPQQSPRLATRARCMGTDQGWLSYILGPHEATWGRADGVYSFRKHLAPHGYRLPADARIVAFHGKRDPWDGKLQRAIPWLREHYPGAVA